MKKELKSLKKALVRNNTLPILDGALIDKGRMYASDLETTVSYPTEIKGSGVVDLRTLADMNFDSAHFEGDRLVIKRGNNTSSMSALNAGEYPMWPETPVKLGKITQVQALKNMLPFTSTDDLRPVMAGVFVGDGWACATDAHQLIFTKRPKSNVKEVILLKRAVNMFDEDEYMVFTNKERSNLRFVGQRQELVTRVVDGRFPNFQHVIPKNCNVIAHVNPKELMAAVTDALPFAHKDVPKVWLSFEKNSLTIGSEDLDRMLEFKTSIDVVWPFPERRFKMGFSGKLLINCLKVLKDQETIPVYMSHHNRAAIFGESILLMPMMLNVDGGEIDASAGWDGGTAPEAEYETPGKQLPDYIYREDQEFAQITEAFARSLENKTKEGFEKCYNEWMPNNVDSLVFALIRGASQELTSRIKTKIIDLIEKTRVRFENEEPAEEQTETPIKAEPEIGNFSEQPEQPAETLDPVFNEAKDVFERCVQNATEQELQERIMGFGIDAAVFARKFVDPDKNQSLYKRIYSLYYDYFNELKANQPEPQTPNPEPQTQNPEPETPCPMPSAPCNDIRLIEYSEKGIAVVGDIDHLRTRLIEAYGSPKTFKHDGTTYKGIAFSKKRLEKVLEIINQ